MDLRPGQIVGNDYRVEQLLAAGGMGAVYVAEQLSTGKRRALKVMHRELASDADSQRRFLQEARVGSRIASEHIVEVQNAGIDSTTGHPFLVMELLEGEDLQARLARGPLSLDDARVIVDQLAHALAAAHDAQVVHRDLKPQNVFLGTRRSTGSTLHVKVLDFGIAKVVENQNATAATGTPMWLAPEQTERGQITAAADVWAFGLIVFTMLTGASFWKTPARKGGSLVDLLTEILRDPIPAASARAAELGKSVPPSFDAWFLRCLSRAPGDRFPDARQAHAALVPILAARPPPQPTAVFAPPPSAPMPPALIHSRTAMGPPSAPMTPARIDPRAAMGPPPAPMPPAGIDPRTAMGPPPAPTPPPPIAPRAPSGSRLGLVVGICVAVVVVVGGIAGVALYLARSLAEATTTPASPAVPPGMVPSGIPGSPLAPPASDGSSVNLIVFSDDPQLQTALLSDATLNPKITQCIASVRPAKRASITLGFEVSSSGAKAVMTQAQPMGPHVQCVINAITNRPLSTPKKKAFLQVMITWS